MKFLFRIFCFFEGHIVLRQTLTNRDKSNEEKGTSEILCTLCIHELTLYTHELTLCTHVCIPSESQKESLMIAGIVMFLGLSQPVKPNPRVPVRGNKLLERV